MASGSDPASVDGTRISHARRCRSWMPWPTSSFVPDGPRCRPPAFHAESTLAAAASYFRRRAQNGDRTSNQHCTDAETVVALVRVTIAVAVRDVADTADALAVPVRGDGPRDVRTPYISYRDLRFIGVRIGPQC